MAGITIDSVTNNPDIPSLPTIVFELQELISNDSPVARIIEIISSDPGITVRILKIANSAWYKRQGTVSTVYDAISIIGLNTLQQLVLAISVTRVFKDIDTSLVDMHSFWKQSIRMGLAAQAIAARYKKGNPIEHFSRGLITYLGKLILYANEPEISQRILKRSRSATLPQYSIENQILGFSHADIAVALFKKWQLPEDFFQPIAFYPYPEKSPEKFRVNAAVLNLAHYTQYAYACSDIELTDPLGPINQYALDLVEMNTVNISKIGSIAASSVDNTIRMFGLVAA